MLSSSTPASQRTKNNNKGKLNRDNTPLYLVTDCKSLYDVVISESPTLSEKRTLIDILSIQNWISPSRMHWVPTYWMIADALTKKDKKLREHFPIG